jgi:hypothetical protein
MRSSITLQNSGNDALAKDVVIAANAGDNVSTPAHCLGTDVARLASIVRRTASLDSRQSSARPRGY